GLRGRLRPDDGGLRGGRGDRAAVAPAADPGTVGRRAAARTSGEPLMPRIAGQIDLIKSEAILEAAADAIHERGLGVSVDEIARRAGVSKQTIYNHYGSK